MPTSIDNRVVKMEFDNESFERKTKVSMSTLDKLKEKLNFEETGKSLDKLSKSTKNFSMDGISNAVSSASGSFNVFETVATGVLLRLGAQITDFAERQIKKLALDQVIAGWDKYTAKIEAVQTILNSTRDVGENIDSVSDKMAELNWFTDETSYNFADMSSNIGKFTANGQDLAESTTAMMGIANWAALSGAKVQQMSMAMYNLSQALGTGALMTKDWMSIENANMATREFKKLAIQTAETMGVLEEGAVTVGTFRESLSEKWFTSDVLMEVLNQYGAFTDRLYYYVDSTGVTASQYLGYIDDFKSGAIEWAEVEEETKLSHERLTAILEDLSQAEYELGLKGLKAGQESKTLRDSIDATADAVSTLWMNVYEGIFGNYEQAKVLWTNVTEYLWDIFAAPVDSLNKLVKGTFADSFDKLGQQIKGVGGNLDDFDEALRRVAIDEGFENITEQYDRMSQALREGAFGDDQVRIVKSVAESYVQALRESSDLTDAQRIALDELEESLKNTENGAGYFIETLDQVGARQQIFDIITNSLNGLEEIISVISDAFSEIFPAPSVSKIQEVIVKIKELTDNFRLYDEETGKLTTTGSRISNVLKGIFSAIDISLNVLKGAFNFIKPYASEAINIILTVASAIGKIIKAVDLFIEKTDIVNRFFNLISTGISNVYKGLDSIFKFLTGNTIKEFFVKTLSSVTAYFEMFAREGADRLNTFVEKLNTFKEKFNTFIGNFTPIKDVFISLFTSIKNTLSDLFNLKFESNPFAKISDSFKNILNSVSPIWEALKKFFSSIFEYFKNFVNNIEPIFASIGKGFEKLFSSIGEGLKKIDLSKILALFSSGGILANGIGQGIGAAKAGSGIGGFFKSLKDMVSDFKSNKDSIFGMFDGIKNALKSFASDLKADSIKRIATAILEIAAAAFVLSMIDGEGLAKASVGLAAIFAELSAFIKNIEKIFSKKSFTDQIGFTAIAAGITALAAAIGVLSVSMTILSLLETDKLVATTLSISVILLTLGETIKIANKNGINASSAIIFVSLAAVITAIGLALTELSLIALLKPEALLVSAGTLAVLIAELVLLTKKLDGITVSAKTSLAIVALSSALSNLVLLITTLTILNKIDMVATTVSVGEVTVLLGVLTICTKALNDINISAKTSLALEVLASAMKKLTILLSALAIIAHYDLKSVIISAVLTGALMEELVLLAKQMSKIGSISASAIVAIEIISLAMSGILTMVSIMAVIASFNTEALLVAAGATAGMMVVLAGALALTALSDPNPTAALALIAIAGALLMLTPALLAFGSLKEPFKAIAELGAVILILVGAGELMKVLGLDTMFLGLSAACLIGAAALVLFGEGIKVVAAGLLALTAAVTTSIEVLGVAAQEKIVAVLVNLISAASEAMLVSFPTIIDTLATLTIELVAFLVAEATTIAAGILLLIANVLQLLAQMIGPIATSICDIIINLLNAVSSRIEGIISAVVDLIINILNGIAKAIILRSNDIVNAFWNIMEALLELAMTVIESVVEGIAGIFGEKAKNKVHSIFEDLKEGSRKTWAPELMQTGKAIVDDVADSTISEIDSRTPDITNAAKKSAESATSDKGFGTFKSGMKNVTGDGLSVFKREILDSKNSFQKSGSDIGGAAVSGYSDSISDLTLITDENTENAVNSMSGYAGLFNNVGFDLGQGTFEGMDEGMRAMIPTLSGTGEDGATTVLNSMNDVLGITGNTSSEGYKTGAAVESSIGDGINAERSSVRNTAASAAKDILAEFDGSESWGEYAGRMFMQGLKNGIKNNSNVAVTAMKNSASSLVNYAYASYQINSPSRIFEEIGKFLMLGEAKGIAENTPTAINAVTSHAERTVESFKNALSPLSNLVTNLVETDPVITPVLDLSQIQNGAKSIGSYFRGARAIALGSTISAGGSSVDGSTVINMTVNGAPGQDVSELADIVSERIAVKIGRGKRVWA